jgi:hypothetical protein
MVGELIEGADMTTAPTARRPQAGPPLLAPVLAFAALTVAYVVVNRTMPHPDASGLTVLRYATTHQGLGKLGALLLLASATPLALTAAVLYRRLRALGVTAPGSAITLVGGVLTASASVLSALFGWTVARLPTDASPALARALADLAYLAGGPAYAMGFALLIAGVSMTGLLGRLLARPLSWAGLVLAAAGMLALFSLLADGFGYLLPLVRFGGTAWLIAVAALLPRTRPRRQPVDTP